MESPELRSGGIVGFSTSDLRDIQADIINIGTFGLPGRGCHHVGILSRHSGTLLIYESTTTKRPPCFYTGRDIAGVSARTVPVELDFFRNTPVKLWYYGLRAPLYCDEEIRLDSWLHSKIEVSYDKDGALHAGGFLANYWFSLMRGEDLSSLFCSETCAAALGYIDRMHVRNASLWSPNRLCRFLVRSGICSPAVRIQ